MQKRKYQIAIIGGGPAGIAAALEASKYSTDVVMISREQPGGRALWHSLTPSKMWLHAAAHSHYQPQDVLNHLQEVTLWQSDNYLKQLHNAGIEVLLGTARFSDEQTLRIDSENNGPLSIHAENIVVAAGSVPIFPDGLKPDGTRIMAPRLLAKMTTVPRSVIIVGGGVTGSEMIYLFSKLGAQVTVVTDTPMLLPRAEAEISDALEKYFRDQGVFFNKGIQAESVTNDGEKVHVQLKNGSELDADYAFLAIGRKADLSSLNLESAGVETDEAIRVDEFCRSNVDSIFAAGDVTGAPMTANRAMAMGRLAAKNALSGKVEALNEKWIVEAIYSEPEVAQVGKVSGENARIYKAPFASNLKAHLSGAGFGFIKVFVDENEKIVGASAIGHQSADLMFSIAIALRSGLTLDMFRQIVPANPTLSEIFIDLMEDKK